MAKRFTMDNGSNEDICLVDNLTKKEYESNFGDIVDVMNSIWEQTQRFEKYNKELMEENEELKEAREYYQENFLTMKTERNQFKRENEVLKEQNEKLKKELFEVSKELLWVTSDEVDRVLHFEDEVEELRKEIFE